MFNYLNKKTYFLNYRTKIQKKKKQQKFTKPNNNLYLLINNKFIFQKDTVYLKELSCKCKGFTKKNLVLNINLNMPKLVEIEKQKFTHQVSLVLILSRIYKLLLFLKLFFYLDSILVVLFRTPKFVLSTLNYLLK